MPDWIVTSLQQVRFLPLPLDELRSSMIAEPEDLRLEVSHLKQQVETLQQSIQFLMRQHDELSKLASNDLRSRISLLEGRMDDTADWVRAKLEEAAPVGLALNAYSESKPDLTAYRITQEMLRLRVGQPQQADPAIADYPINMSKIFRADVVVSTQDAWTAKDGKWTLSGDGVCPFEPGKFYSIKLQATDNY